MPNLRPRWRVPYEQILGTKPRFYRKNAFNDTIRFAERGFAAVTFRPRRRWLATDR